MVRAGALAVGLIWGGGTAANAGQLSSADLDLYRAAFRHVENGQWSDARARAAEARDHLPAKVVQWLDMARPQSGNSFAAISGFIRANPQWPNQTGLQRQAEATMPPDLSAGEVRSWFDQHPPVSAAGVGRYVDALNAHGEAAKANALVRKFWTDANFISVDDESDFRRRFIAILHPQDHQARLDRLLWDHQGVAARRLFGVVDDGHQALALARMALAEDQSGADAVVGRVPEALAADSGLAYERLHWRRKKDDDAGAVDILRAAPANLGRPALWWTERAILIRRVLEKQDAATAYRLAKDHGQTEGPSLAEAEFLGGWLALRFLKQPSEAFDHFHRMVRAAATPMSRARGAYWCGRAAEALGDRKQAQKWYDAAARYPTMFYGQLAASALGGDHLVALPAEPSVPSAESADFSHRELVRVVRLLHEIDPRDTSDRSGLFLRRLTRDSSRPLEFEQLGRLALELNRPELAIFVAKQAFQAGVTLIEPGYPTLSLGRTGTVEPGLVLSLIRQESTFNTTIVSSAGARGLMQLMPATAQLVATRLGLRHSDARLIAEPEYNIALGSSYIGQLIDNYNGSYFMAIAAYNAGSGRVHDWVSRFGDPRHGESVEATVDWIESIPIAETRNYVQRVLEALQVYRLRLGSREHTLKQDLRR